MPRSGNFVAGRTDGLPGWAFDTGERKAGKFAGILTFGAILSLLLTAGSYFGQRWWVLELFTHFRVQMLAGALLLLAVALLAKCRRISLAALVVAGANLVPLLPLAVTGAAAMPPADASPIRLMSANVWFRNRDYQAAMDLIAAENPDIVGLLEVDDAWIGQLSALHARYPHKVLYPEDGAYGMALFSRFPLRELAPSPYVTAGTQAGIFVEVQLPGRSFDLLLAHLIAPTTADRAKLRNRQLAGIAQMLRARGGQEQILAGDFNITPWSPYYAQLERQTRMTNAARVSGYRPTWPTGFNPLKIPIDHFLVSGGFEITQFRTAADIGSDHLPIVLDVIVTDLPVSRSL